VRPLDVLRQSAAGLRYRPLRAALSALGIALGTAAMVAIVGVPASAQAALLAQLGRDGNLLTVATGRTVNGQLAPLPETAAGMLRRIDGVQTVAPVGMLAGLTVRRSSAVPVKETNGIAVLAAEPALVGALNLTVVAGRFLDAATGRYPTVVLGAAAARSLGISRLTPQTQVYLGSGGFSGNGGRYAVVLGVLAPVPLAPELDTGALLGTAAAGELFGFDGRPTRVYLRADPDRVPAVWARLAATTNPANPGMVTVGRPSDLLVARASARGALLGLALGLGAVALLVGGVGVANVMVVSVLERRAEIGVRRALGATRSAVAMIFLGEATALCVLGALTGTALGVLTTIGYVLASGASLVLPAAPLAAGLAGSVLVGLVAGCYPALRAARLAPTEALRAG
jgi:putative ABC transport system permease protein